MRPWDNAPDLAGPGRLPADADRELRGGRHLRLDAGQATDHPRDGELPDRIQLCRRIRKASACRQLTFTRAGVGGVP